MTEYPRHQIGLCCICSAPFHVDGFRDFSAYREAYLSSMCQTCQDLCFLACDSDGGPSSLFDGALVKRRVSAHRLAEVAFFPFRMIITSEGKAHVVWEARYIVRAGPLLDPLDPRSELEPMAAHLSSHQVFVASCTLRDPAVVALLDRLHLLVAIDGAELADVGRVCALPDDLACATCDEIPWQAEFGRALRPLDTWWAPDLGPRSTLRSLATLARLLVEEGRAGLRPLDHLLASRPGFFEDESDVDV